MAGLVRMVVHMVIFISRSILTRTRNSNVLEKTCTQQRTLALPQPCWVNTLEGAVKLNVAPETQNNTKVKLKGKGFPIYKKDGHFGDLYVTYNVELPKGLSKEEKELFQQLAELRKTD